MKKAVFLLLLSVSVLVPVFSQNLDTDFVEEVTEGLSAVASSIISDTFSPMTFYDRGDLFFMAVPAVFFISDLYEDPEIEGDGLWGSAFGIGAGCAVSDRLMVWGILSYLGVYGDITSSRYGYSSSCGYHLVNLNGGAGFDLLSHERFSLPVYAGFSLQYYHLEMDFDDYIVGTDTVHTEISGSQVLPGISGGMAFSSRIHRKFRVTPYFLFMMTFTEIKVESTISTESLPIPLKADINGEPYRGFLIGFDAGMDITDEWSFSISLGGLLSSLLGFNRAVADGLKMTPVVASVSYRMNLLEKKRD